MTLSLTPQQSAALQSETGPVRLRDPATNATYVLVREEAMGSLQTLFADGPLTPVERETILRGVWKRADWDDPAMDEYARLASPMAAP
jgi:hypothetical protein